MRFIRVPSKLTSFFSIQNQPINFLKCEQIYALRNSKSRVRNRSSDPPHLPKNKVLNADRETRGTTYIESMTLATGI